MRTSKPQPQWGEKKIASSSQRGGLGKAHQLFGEQLLKLPMNSTRCWQHE